jgi:hypothetical protein
MRPLVSPRSPRTATWIAALVATFALAGCQRTINMATIQDPSWVATTIPYTGVREANRQFPDYNIIDASILKPAPDRAKSPAPGKRGAPR